MNDQVATRILTQALREGKAAALLDCLFEGGTATVDARSGHLVLIPGPEVVRLAEGD